MKHRGTAGLNVELTEKQNILIRHVLSGDTSIANWFMYVTKPEGRLTNMPKTQPAIEND
jgi:hypothetical protein